MIDLNGNHRSRQPMSMSKNPPNPVNKNDKNAVSMKKRHYTRKRIEKALDSFVCQLGTIPKIGSYGMKNYRWVEINAKKEVCEELLGQR